MNISSISYRRDVPEKQYQPMNPAYTSTANPSLIGLGPRGNSWVDRKSLKLDDEFKYKLINFQNSN